VHVQVHVHAEMGGSSRVQDGHVWHWQEGACCHACRASVVSGAVKVSAVRGGGAGQGPAARTLFAYWQLHIVFPGFGVWDAMRCTVTIRASAHHGVYS
jgi:hypothetical protein